MTAESTIQKNILDWLNEQDECKAINIHMDGAMERGTPDVLVCYKGYMLAIEVKRPGETPTKIQKHRLKQWQDAGAFTMTATSLTAVKAMIAFINS